VGYGIFFLFVCWFFILGLKVLEERGSAFNCLWANVAQGRSPSRSAIHPSGLSGVGPQARAHFGWTGLHAGSPTRDLHRRDEDGRSQETVVQYSGSRLHRGRYKLD